MKVRQPLNLTDEQADKLFDLARADARSVESVIEILLLWSLNQTDSVESLRAKADSIAPVPE